LRLFLKSGLTTASSACCFAFLAGGLDGAGAVDVDAAGAALVFFLAIGRGARWKEGREEDSGAGKGRQGRGLLIESGRTRTSEGAQRARVREEARRQVRKEGRAGRQQRPPGNPLGLEIWLTLGSARGKGAIETAPRARGQQHAAAAADDRPRLPQQHRPSSTQMRFASPSPPPPTAPLVRQRSVAFVPAPAAVQPEASGSKQRRKPPPPATRPRPSGRFGLDLRKREWDASSDDDEASSDEAADVRASDSSDDDGWARADDGLLTRLERSERRRRRARSVAHPDLPFRALEDGPLLT
jgi:hypothetical protein